MIGALFWPQPSIDKRGESPMRKPGQVGAVVLCLTLVSFVHAQPAQDYKAQVVKDVDAMVKQTQVMVDMVFSFGELGFQEIETSKYLTGILEKEGFKI